MPKQNEPTTKFKVDISELKKGIQDAQRQIRLANAEFKAASSGMDDWSKSADGISAKLKQLGTTLSSQESVLDSLKKQYAAVAEEQGESSKGAQELAIKIANQEAAINGTKKAIAQYEQALSDVDNESDDVAKASEKAEKGLEDVGDAAKDTEKDADGLKTKLADLAKSGLKAVATAAAGLVTAFLGSAESTREFREAMAKVDTAFTTAGYSAETGKKTFEDFAAILGDTDQATEAVGNLAKLATSEQDLAKWTEIATGVYGSFGDGLPIEGLTEAANETAKVAKVTGPLADALNWATTDTEKWNEALSGNKEALAAFQKGVGEGMNAEDAFNEALLACNDEQERSQLITSTLSSLYSDAAKEYEKTAGDIMDANRAQTQLNEAMAEVGKVAEPVMTTLKTMGAEILNSILPSVQELGDGFRDMLNGVEGAGDKVGEAVSGILMALINKVVEIAPQVVTVGLSLITNLIKGILESLPSVLDAAITVAHRIIDGIILAAPELLQAAIEFFNTIAEALPYATEKIMTLLLELVYDLVYGLIDAMPQLLDGAKQFFTAIADAIPEVLPMILEMIPLIIDAVVDFITSATPMLLDAAISFLNAIVEAIPQIISALVEALPQIITSIITAIVTAVPQLLQAAITLFMAVVDAIPDVLPQLIEAIPQIVVAIADALIENLPLLAECAITLFMTLVEAIPTIIVALAKAVPKIVTAIMDALFKIVPKLIELGTEIFTNFGTYWETVITTGQEKTDEFVQTVIEFLTTLIPKTWKVLTQVIKKVVTWGTNLIKTGKEKATGFINAVINVIKGLPGKIQGFLSQVINNVIAWGSSLVEKGRQAASNFITNVVNKIKELPGNLQGALSSAIDAAGQFAVDMGNKAVEAGKKFVSGVVDNIKSIPGSVRSIGQNIVAGLWNGINDKFEWLTRQIKSFASNVTGSLKKFFGIKSPSRVMRDQVGKYLAQGIAVGIDENRDAVNEAFNSLKADLMTPIDLNINGAKSRVVSGNANQGSPNAGGSSGGANYVFNQYNTSPKPLSRLEIYRQTRNQLNFAKGV